MNHKLTQYNWREPDCDKLAFLNALESSGARCMPAALPAFKAWIFFMQQKLQTFASFAKIFVVFFEVCQSELAIDFMHFHFAQKNLSYNLPFS